jgi:hypothetical protein
MVFPRIARAKRRKEECSFLKERTQAVARAVSRMDKVFLLLFPPAATWLSDSSEKAESFDPSPPRAARAGTRLAVRAVSSEPVSAQISLLFPVIGADTGNFANFELSRADFSENRSVKTVV